MYRDNHEKIVATIEARMTSTRLPGKVMLPLLGKPVLQRIIERLQQSTYIDEIVVATTTNDTDNVLEKLARQCSVGCFRGSEDDVLGRVFQATRSVSGDVVVRASGDNPILDAELTDRGLELFFENDVDYMGSGITKTFPTGLYVEVLPTHVLAEVESLTSDPVDRSHVTSFIYQNPDTYKLYVWEAEGELRFPELRLTLDEQADYDLIQGIYKRLTPENEHFSARDAVRLLKREPALARINHHVRQKSIKEL